MGNLYLYLTLFTLLGPLVLSFDKKVAFYKSWKHLFPGIFIMSLIFISWDVAFEHYDIWGFNDDYLIGIRFFGLPIEEWLFFIVVPYACVFIYACLNAYISCDVLEKFYRPFLWLLVAGLFITGVLFYNRLYTSITFLGTAGYLFYHLINRSYWLSRFLLAYLVSLIPFLLVNGVLTGWQIENEIVWYNSSHILNLRIGTIPVEDAIYNLFMLLITVHVYENLMRRSQGK
ncbi:MAG: lycopene cyclase domain-containing protein [Flavobacteriales bacterium]